MDKSMHVSRATYVSAFEHIPYSARGSAITHVASARVHMTPLACAGGEHQYLSGIEVKQRTSRFYPHTRILPNMAWSALLASVRVSCSVYRHAVNTQTRSGKRDEEQAGQSVPWIVVL